MSYFLFFYYYYYLLKISICNVVIHLVTVYLKILLETSVLHNYCPAAEHDGKCSLVTQAS